MFYAIQIIIISILSVIALVSLPCVRKYFKATAIYHFLIFLESLYVFPIFFIYDKLENFILCDKDRDDISLINTINIIGRVTIQSIEFKEKINILNILIFIVLTGCICLILLDIVKYRKAKQMLKRWSKKDIDNDIQIIFCQLLKEMDVDMPVKLIKNDLIKSPMVMGILKKTLFIPSTAENLDKYMIRNYIYHELEHIKQNDNLIALGVRIVEILLWYNPVNHFFCKNIKLYCELSCDEKVLLNKDKDFKFAYIETILTTANWKNKYQSVFINNFSENKRIMGLRVKALLDSKNCKDMKLLYPVFLFILILFSSFLYSKISLGNSEIYRVCKDIVSTQNINSDNYYGTVISQIFNEISTSIYRKYEECGISYDDVNRRLYYNDKLIRNFIDARKYNKTVLYYLDGDIDVYVLRDKRGKIVGIKEVNS